MTNARTFIALILAAIGAGSMTACGPSMAEWQPEKHRRVFYVPRRQTAEEPVYNRLRWVQLPENLPATSGARAGGPAIMPVFHLQLKNATLEQAALALAATARYKSYCASSLANKKVSIERLGTLDELAEELGKTAKIRVSVDHELKEVRLLAEAVEPKMLSGSEVKPEAAKDQGLKNEVTNEHKSDNQRKTL